MDPTEFWARDLLSAERHRVPDLSAVTVLVPHHAAGAALARSLARFAELPALAPPRLLPLPIWTEQAPSAIPAAPASLRRALLYRALQGRNWFDTTALWAVCGELLELHEELTLHRVALPRAPDELHAALAAAYAAPPGPTLEFEARLVHGLWQALAEAHSPAAHYLAGLAWLAEHADGPLYILPDTLHGPAEDAFLLRYAERQPVHRLEWPDSAARRALALAWGTDAPLGERARNASGQFAVSPLAGQLSLFAAQNLEEEARAACAQVRLWLAQGRHSIALVAQDRLVARRLRALLEREHILVADETGWKLATTAASAAVTAWLDALAGNFRHQQLLDLLKSPFLLADMEPAARRAGLAALEFHLRRFGPADTLAQLQSGLLRSGADPAAQALLRRLADAAAPLLPLRPRTAARWIASLKDSLGRLGAQVALAGDAAGTQWLQWLERLERDWGADGARYSFAEWRGGLAANLEEESFVDRTITSPVIFTHLAGAVGRPFDAVLILGASAARLPAPDRISPFFNQRVRGSLHLPTWETETALQQAHLAALLAYGPAITVTWQSRSPAGEDQAASPWIERLESFHQAAWGTSLLSDQLRQVARLQDGPIASGGWQATAAPAPVVPPARLPRRISPSGAQTLLDCPYRYFAQGVLSLTPLEEISAQLEKRDYGEYVHRILQAFQARFPVLGDTPEATLTAALEEETQKAFAHALQAHYLGRAWLARWRARIPAWIGWQKAREALGWRYLDGEVARGLTLGEEGLELAGRLDRLDQAAGALAVLDYKTQGAQALRDKINTPEEDAQLALYTLLADPGRVRQAAYVGLEETPVREYALPEAELAPLARSHGERLIAIFSQLAAGAGMAANGIEPICAHCDMRGLCRKDHWG